MDEECLPQPHERPRVDGPRLEARRVGVVVLAALRQVQPRAPAEPRRREEGQVSHPEPARRERAMQPFVTEGHHGIRAELDDIDGDLPERLRGVDDGDRSGVAGETACFADRQHVPGLARDERDEECAGSALHAAANLFEETIRVAVPRDLAQAIAELGAAAERIERAPMLLGRGEDERALRDGEAGDQRVEPIGRRLCEGDPLGAGRIAEGSGEVRTRRVEGRVVRRVADVAEHADLVQPRPEALGGQLRNGKRRARPRDVEVQSAATKRLKRGWGCVRPLLEARCNVGHAVIMPRIARPAAKSAANPSATDWPRAARSRTTEAASGSARASANPYRTWSASAGGRRNAKTTKPSTPCATEAITAIAIAPRKPGVGPLFRTPRNRPQRPTAV